MYGKIATVETKKGTIKVHTDHVKKLKVSTEANKEMINEKRKLSDVEEVLSTWLANSEKYNMETSIPMLSDKIIEKKMEWNIVVYKKIKLLTTYQMLHPNVPRQ